MDATRRIIFHNERGVALVYLALTLVVLMGMGALAVDMSYMYVAKSQLQNAADAAALAGAAKLRGRPILQCYSARSYSQTYALRNRAAGQSVTVDLNDSNDSNGDIVICCWNGSSCDNNSTTCTEPNSVQVTTRRTGDTGTGIASTTLIPTFFAKVIGISQLGVKATATAMIQKAAIRPIIVNEYWVGGGPYNAETPNIQDYPNSFVRKNNINGSPSPLFKKTFAILGSEADSNTNPPKTDGMVVLDYRNTNFDGSGTWYQINTASPSGNSCTNCGANFTLSSATTFNSDPIKDVMLSYLTSPTGYPEQFILPTAIREQLVTPTNRYPRSTYSYPTGPTSDCPYSTVGYRSVSGSANFTDWKPGDKMVAAVYDGSLGLTSDLNSVNIVGFSLIEIDGYSRLNSRFLLTNSNFFGNDKQTMYGHAVEDILEPSSITSPPGMCSDPLFILMREMRYRGGTVKLVK